MKSNLVYAHDKFAKKTTTKSKQSKLSQSNHFDDLTSKGPLLKPTDQKRPNLDVGKSESLNAIELRISLNGTKDISRIIQTVKSCAEIGFLYLKMVHERSSVDFHAYNVQVVPFECVDPDRDSYMTISCKGIIEYRNGQAQEFTALDEWEKECSICSKMRHIEFFKYFFRFKSFIKWHKLIILKKTKNAKENLVENLFFISSVIGECGILKDTINSIK